MAKSVVPRIDFHSHILPHCDHGSKDLETSLWQINSAKENKIKLIIATPHFYAQKHNVDSFLEKREICFRNLLPYLKDGMLDVVCGAEVLLYDGLDKMEGIEKLCIEGTNILLCELPFNSVDESISEVVENLIKKKNLIVVLAHADRYDPKIIEACIEVGALIQLNVDGYLSLRTRKECISWIERDLVYALGSDIHEKQDAYEKFDKAVKKLGSTADVIFKKTMNLLFKGAKSKK